MNFTLDADTKFGELMMTGVNPDKTTKVRRVTVKLMQGNTHVRAFYDRSKGDAPLTFPVTFDLSGLDFKYTRVKVYFLGFKRKDKKKKRNQSSKIFCVHKNVFSTVEPTVKPTSLSPSLSQEV
jgi:hypothetical protein